MKRIHRILPHLFAALAIVAFVGCATPYQKSGFTGGFIEGRRGRNGFTVAFAGNGYTSGARAADLCLLRCAELTLGNGYRYFVLTDNRSHVDTSTSVTSGTYGGGLMFATTQSIPKPSTANAILCFREQPVGFNDHFDAQKIFSDLSSKYGITKSAQHLDMHYSSKALLGIYFEMIDGLTAGQRVRGFADGGFAAQAGIKAGDTVLALNGIPLTQKDAIGAEAAKWQVGDTVEVTVERGMKKLKIPVQTIVNNRGIRFRTVREDLGKLPPIDARRVTIIEGTETPFTYNPVADYVDYENPLENIEEFKEIAAREAAVRGANVVHILRNHSEALQYFGKVENTQMGFTCGLLYAPPAALGLTYETGTSYEKRRVVRRVLNPAAQEAGLRIGDNVLALNGIDVLSEPTISKELAKWKVGDVVEVTVARDGKELKIPVKVISNDVQKAGR